jgi:hypothetical protein
LTLGSGKVAGKVLIVDQYAVPAKILILLERVLKWCFKWALNPLRARHFQRSEVRVSRLK